MNRSKGSLPRGAHLRDKTAALGDFLKQDGPSVYYNPTPRPWLCPVCKGRLRVPADFYQHHATTPLEPDDDRWLRAEPCKTCNERGVLWGA